MKLPTSFPKLKGSSTCFKVEHHPNWISSTTSLNSMKCLVKKCPKDYRRTKAHWNELRTKFFPMAGSLFKFNQHGQSGAWMSDLMPYTAKIVDELCFIKSMYTNAINHDPAITMIQTDRNYLEALHWLLAQLRFGNR